MGSRWQFPNSVKHGMFPDSRLKFCQSATSQQESASDSQHLAAELCVRYSKNRAAIPAISLNTDTSVITAIGNDFGFDYIFSISNNYMARVLKNQLLTLLG